jgi:hypothetical protein
VLRRIFGLKKDELTGERGKVNNEVGNACKKLNETT